MHTWFSFKKPMWKTAHITTTVLRPFVQDHPGELVRKWWTILGFTEAETMGWQWHQLDHMQVICTLLQTDNLTSTTSLFSRAGCSSCHPTNSIKALKKSPQYQRNEGKTYTVKHIKHLFEFWNVATADLWRLNQCHSHEFSILSFNQS